MNILIRKHSNNLASNVNYHLFETACSTKG